MMGVTPYFFEVLIKHGVAQVVTHFGRFVNGGSNLVAFALFFGPLFGPVDSVDGAGICVWRVGVLPLFGVVGVFGEQV